MIARKTIGVTNLRVSCGNSTRLEPQSGQRTAASNARSSWFPYLKHPASLEIMGLRHFDMDGGERRGHEPVAFELRFIVNGGWNVGVLESLLEFLRRRQLIERGDGNGFHGAT